MGVLPRRPLTVWRCLVGAASQVRDTVGGRVLVGVSLPAPWERVVELCFGQRPGEPPSHHLYVEVMAR